MAKREKQSRRWRHGDVVIDEVESIPKEATPKKGNTLAEGEATGHAHRVIGDAKLMLFVSRANDTPNAVYFAAGGEAVRIGHEEHKTHELPAGGYRATQKRQYTPDGWETVHD